MSIVLLKKPGGRWMTRVWTDDSNVWSDALKGAVDLLYICGPALGPEGVMGIARGCTFRIKSNGPSLRNRWEYNPAITPRDQYVLKPDGSPFEANRKKVEALRAPTEEELAAAHAMFGKDRMDEAAQRAMKSYTEHVKEKEESKWKSKTSNR
jgi:hypothetical protein